ncbi:DUF1178 family protein [Altererythrobacter sp.]|uniref:DUF1178 family protein n=1 Tax=Altererythrobacter sp. TaxID=1872480 RepID=UPI003D01591D
MIVFDLICDEGHRFEGWFGSSSDFSDQQASGLLCCPQCGTPAVGKAPMAPAVPAKANTQDTSTAPRAMEEQHPVSNKPMPAEVQKALAALAKAQEKALKNSTWVGDKFAEHSRAMHYGEQDEKPIHGRASSEEAQNLLDEGISVAPLPFPIAPPEELN